MTETASSPDKPGKNAFLFVVVAFLYFFFFFFKQKTAYEIGTGDWSSDVCSSDLEGSKGSLIRNGWFQWFAV